MGYLPMGYLALVALVDVKGLPSSSSSDTIEFCLVGGGAGVDDSDLGVVNGDDIF
jgi:hypothetical protein